MRISARVFLRVSPFFAAGENYFTEEAKHTHFRPFRRGRFVFQVALDVLA